MKNVDKVIRNVDSMIGDVKNMVRNVKVENERVIRNVNS